MMLVIRLPCWLDLLGCALSICNIFAVEWFGIRFFKILFHNIFLVSHTLSHSVCAQQTDHLMHVRKAITRFIAFCIDLRYTTTTITFFSLLLFSCTQPYLNLSIALQDTIVSVVFTSANLYGRVSCDFETKDNIIKTAVACSGNILHPHTSHHRM